MVMLFHFLMKPKHFVHQGPLHPEIHSVFETEVPYKTSRPGLESAFAKHLEVPARCSLFQRSNRRHHPRKANQSRKAD